MSYIQDNKAAWEEAFEHRQSGWGETNDQRLLHEVLPFFDPNVIRVLKTIDFQGKTVGQFCCNNGRELLSLMQLGAKQGYGFDIAENIIEQARETAHKAGITNCAFVATNILEIDEKYDNQFDYIMFTIGALTWFQDLPALFDKVSKCLKRGGMLLIHEYHPFMNMLATPGEPSFDETHLDQIAYSYFRHEPWSETDGMCYMSESYISKTFTSFAHTMSSIVNAIIHHDMNIVRFDEFDYDIGLTDAYDQQGYPLSYLLVAKKQS